MKQKARQAIQAKIKADLIKETGKVCFFCEQTFSGVDLVHIIRQSYSTELSIEKRNCVLGCRAHHTIFDDGYDQELRELPNLELVLDKMKAIDELYYNRFMDKVNGDK